MFTSFSIYHSRHMAIRAPKVFRRFSKRVSICAVLFNRSDLIVGIKELAAFLFGQSKSPFHAPTPIYSMLNGRDGKSRIPSILSEGSDINAFSQSAFQRPAHFKPAKENGVCYTQDTAPFGDGKSFSVKRERMVGTHIARLLISCSPSAITWFVVAVIVGIAIEGVFVAETFAHIGKKVVKRFKPSVTNHNSTSTVSSKRFMSIVKTSTFHRVICGVLRRHFEPIVRGLNVSNARIIVSHLGFTSLVKFHLVRLGESVSALRRAVFILPRQQEFGIALGGLQGAGV